MRYFLAKTEPQKYSIDQLEADRKTTWDGVTNAQAVRAIHEMKPGDTVLMYHSGGQSAIVGFAKVVSESRPDPNEPKSAIVEFEYAGRVEPPVTLADVKQSKQFEDWALVRQSRLSTMAVPDKFVQWLRTQRPGLKC